MQKHAFCFVSVLQNCGLQKSIPFVFQKQGVAPFSCEKDNGTKCSLAFLVFQCVLNDVFSYATLLHGVYVACRVHMFLTHGSCKFT